MMCVNKRYEAPVTPLYHPTPSPGPVFPTVAPQHVPGHSTPLVPGVNGHGAHGHTTPAPFHAQTHLPAAIVSTPLYSPPSDRYRRRIRGTIPRLLREGRGSD